MALSESFWIFLTTSGVGLALALMKICYDSKCKQLDICCIKIIRDIQAEENIEHDKIEHGINNELRNPTIDRQPNK